MTSYKKECERLNKLLGIFIEETPTIILNRIVDRWGLVDKEYRGTLIEDYNAIKAKIE